MSSGFLPIPPPEIPHKLIPKEIEFDEDKSDFLEIPAEKEDKKEEEPTHTETGTNTEPPMEVPVRKISVHAKKVTPVPIAGDEITRMVEKILSEGFEDVYKELPIAEQQAFKIKGEQTAHSIRELLRETKLKMHKIFRLIYNWLKMLPGINTFFLEQEAKIKADKIASLKYHDPNHWADRL